MARLLNVSTLLLALASTPLIWRRLGAGYALYTTLLLLIPASSASMSLIRYVLVAFPFFMILGQWGRYAWLDKTLTTCFAVMLGVLTTVFVNWFFAA